MPTIEFLSDNKSVEVKQGEAILQTSLRAGILHTHVCGGKARCTTCRIILLDGNEVKLSAPAKKKSNWRINLVLPQIFDWPTMPRSTVT
jgi:ferredoxin